MDFTVRDVFNIYETVVTEFTTKISSQMDDLICKGASFPNNKAEVINVCMKKMTIPVTDTSRGTPFVLVNVETQEVFFDTINNHRTSKNLVGKEKVLNPDLVLDIIPNIENLMNDVVNIVFNRNKKICMNHGISKRSIASYLVKDLKLTMYNGTKVSLIVNPAVTKRLRLITFGHYN